MGRIFVLVLSVLVSACSINTPLPLRDKIHATIEIVDEIPKYPRAYGLASCNNGYCYIWIRRDKYPLCITHEVMHGFSDGWHGELNSTQFCDIEE